MEAVMYQRKIEANRKNALKSTGPKTEKGKNVVKWNALKHGLLASEVVFEIGDGKEDKNEFKRLFSQLREDLQPIGVIEEMLVERIAICYWRLRRVIRCEVGEIRKELDNIVWDSTNEKIDKYEFAKRFIEIDEQKNKIRKTSFGIDYLIEELDNIKGLFEELGYISEDIKEKLAKNFGTDDRSLTVNCLLIERFYQHYLGESENDKERNNHPLPEEKKQILTIIDDQRKKLEKVKKIIQKYENNELDAKWESLYLPSKEAVDKILRYETTIERQLYRAINQLEWLQSKRN